jgi:dolichol-phosphate mannosyltransferase
MTRAGVFRTTGINSNTGPKTPFTDVGIIPGVGPEPGAGPTLAIVMPARNEVGCIRAVVAQWAAVLDSVGLVDESAARMIVVDSGSTDGTSEVLAELATSDRRIRVAPHAIPGHGAAVMRGYELALESGARYVFQVDSDNEFDPSEFTRLWRNRYRAPFVFGCRVRRSSPAYRRLISATLRVLLHLLFQLRIPDSNVPYRLMRRDYLELAVERIPAGVFIPNVFMSTVAHALPVPVLYVPISHRQRTSGQVSIGRWRLVRACLQCLRQLVAWRITFGPMRSTFPVYSTWFNGQPAELPEMVAEPTEPALAAARA